MVLILTCEQALQGVLPEISLLDAIELKDAWVTSQVLIEFFHGTSLSFLVRLTTVGAICNQDPFKDFD